MSDKLTINEINRIINSQDFCLKYEEYRDHNKDKINELARFVESVKENKTYLRFRSSRKDENLKKSEIFLKGINSILNKMTENTFNNLYDQLLNLLKNNTEYITLFFKDILFKCIDNHSNCQLYIKCIAKLKENGINNSEYEIQLKHLYDSIISIQSEDNLNNYQKLCLKNKIIDNRIYYNKLLTYLDIFNIYKNNIEDMVQKMIINIDPQKDKEENYKYISNLYEIFIILKDKYDLYNNNKDKLKYHMKDLDSKSKFKIMDIIDMFE
tara:strand:+ start:12 stop:815 length:804 start_codon:yes stop_codon:yes gene_type:complete